WPFWNASQFGQPVSSLCPRRRKGAWVELVNERQRTTKKKMTIIEITLWIKAFAGLVTAVVALVAALKKLVKAFRHRRRSTMGIRNVVPPRRKLRQLR